MPKIAFFSKSIEFIISGQNAMILTGDVIVGILVATSARGTSFGLMGVDRDVGLTFWAGFVEL